jgi:hypothetical protein
MARKVTVPVKQNEQSSSLCLAIGLKDAKNGKALNGSTKLSHWNRSFIGEIMWSEFSV